MWVLMRRNLFWYVSHFCTFTMFTLMGLANHIGGGHHPEIHQAISGCFIVIWLSSSIFFSELDESYAFLSTLPVTARDIVSAKFSLMGLAALAYLAVSSYVICRMDLSAGQTADGLSFVFASACLAVLLGCGFYLGIFLCGLKHMAPWIWGIAAAALLLGIGAQDSVVAVIGALFPWPLWAILLLAAIGGWVLAFRAAVRVKRSVRI